MQTFKDTTNGRYYQFEDDVIVTQKNSAYVFTAAHGRRLNVPATLVPGELPAPDSPTFEEMKSAKLTAINAAFTQAAAALTEGYPEAERMTWATQQQEALAWAADAHAPTPYLDGLALARGIDPEEMRQKTLTQTQLFMQASQQLVGKRQRLRDLVHEAETLQALDAIQWSEPAV